MNVQRQEPYIFHITSRSLWEQERETNAYRGDTLESEGFIHCSKPKQTVAVANARFGNRNDMVLLVIHTPKVVSPITYEGTSAEVYPHIYGLLNRDAIVAVYDFLPNKYGNFRLPEEVLTYVEVE